MSLDNRVGRCTNAGLPNQYDIPVPLSVSFVSFSRSFVSTRRGSLSVFLMDDDDDLAPEFDCYISKTSCITGKCDSFYTNNTCSLPCY